MLLGYVASIVTGGARKAKAFEAVPERLRELTHNLVVVRVSADPNPIDTFFDLSSQRTVMITDTRGPKLANSLEVQGGVTGVGFEERKVLVGQCPDIGRQRIIQSPEPRGGKLPQSSRAFPAL